MLALSACLHYGRVLHRYLVRRLRDREIARDLEQEVYLRLLRVSDATLVRDPRAYAYRIATNVVYEYHQREERHAIVYDSDAIAQWDEHAVDSGELPGDPLAEQMDHRRSLKNALARVPERWQAAFILHTRDGMTYPEIATQLRISPSTVKKYVTAAFLTLRRDVQVGDAEPQIEGKQHGS
jgi:RNA polymerase sigma-70 factor (ECF subfamily)